MRRLDSGCGAVLLLLVMQTKAVLPATATTTFQVQIIIGNACVITGANDLNFGTQGVLSANVDATTTVSVQCTSLLPYTIGFNAGTGAGATMAVRKMTGPASATVNYSLYQDFARVLVWGNTIGLDAIPAIGTGLIANHTVYGRVPAQSTPQAGTYTDTITVTVTY